MIKIGITGQSGFVGTHLFNTLGLHPEIFERIPFEDAFFSDIIKLNSFVKRCDVVVHLAAMNRHNDPEVIYQTNLSLVKQLISACEITKSTPHILFSSSTQEERNNLYGKSKRDGRLFLEKWAKKHQARFTGFLIPNVFGPYGNPYYNSVVATFCYQLTHNEIPIIDNDSEIKLIYVSELTKHFIDKILEHNLTQDPESKPQNRTILIPNTSVISVSNLLKKLTEYRDNYFTKGILPDLQNTFDRNLFNTFICFIDHSTFFPFELNLHKDDRGSFVELVKLNSGGQISFSTTLPGITRGNHFHTRKAERFAVIKGYARIELRKIGTEQVISFELEGNKPSFVDMPVWFTHNITNIGKEDLYTIFWISEHYNSDDPDTYFEKV